MFQNSNFFFLTQIQPVQIIILFFTRPIKILYFPTGMRAKDSCLGDSGMRDNCSSFPLRIFLVVTEFIQNFYLEFVKQVGRLCFTIVKMAFGLHPVS